MNNKDLSDINALLRRFGIYVYDKNEKNKLALIEMEIKELFKHGLITKEEFAESLLILRKRG